MPKKFIKVNSKFVKEKTHQVTSDGKILEREWTTVGGRPSQVPNSESTVYKTDNFLITTSNSSNLSYDVLPDKWVTTEDGLTEWTMDDVNKNEDYFTDTAQDKVNLNSRIYDLRDYAYYGSCQELIRGSINDILSKFPGELYVTNASVKYYQNEEYLVLGGSDKVFVSNPFNINIHELLIDVPSTNDSLKYFSNEGYKEYEVIDNNGNSYDITSWNVVPSNLPNAPYSLVSTIKLTFNSQEHSFYLYTGENCSIFLYLTSINNVGYHIRPKNKLENTIKGIVDKRHFDDFINSLDEFERILLNTDTDPKYKATFNVYQENDNGFNVSIESFIFPTNEGGYNISNSTSFKDYVNNLIDVARLFDEYFSDNVYRMLTHEVIKNYDWSYLNNNLEKTDESDILGQTKFANLLHLYGREFDILKLYIDNIKNSNNVSYGGYDDTPKYNLNNLLKNDGWDIKNVFPFIKTNGKYAQIEKTNDIISPYSASSGSSFISNKEYSLMNINDIFLKNLKLNSRYILRHKGTINGIEMLLSLFGLKSQRWSQHHKNEVFDYSIKEYSSFIYPLIETYDSTNMMGKIDYYNSAKLISYDDDNYLNGVYENYRGLPLMSISGSNISNDYSHLYPFFDRSKTYDGDMFYQMNGGWMQKFPFDFNNDDEIISATEVDLFSQTQRNIKVVDNLQDLLSNKTKLYSKGEIVYVKNIDNDNVIIDGQFNAIISDLDNSGNTVNYISFIVYSNSINIGNNTFNGIVVTSDKNGNPISNDLSFMDDGSEIKCYIYKVDNRDTLFLYSNNVSFSTISFYDDYKSETNYYILASDEGYQEVGPFGWIPISEDDKEYKNILRIRNYTNGNNPHVATVEYDNGYEYMNHYFKLFKTPLEDNLFDNTLFNNDYETMYNTLSNIGFYNCSNIENTCTQSYLEIEDDKIHVFSDNIEPNGQINKNSWMSGDDIFSSYTQAYKINQLFSGEPKYASDLIKYIIPKNFDNTTNSIVNTKRIDIIFNNNLFGNMQYTENSKYLLTIINNYISQLIPSNVICHFKFNG